MFYTVKPKRKAYLGSTEANMNNKENIQTNTYQRSASTERL
jgi:hypothetical protein